MKCALSFPFFLWSLLSLSAAHPTDSEMRRWTGVDGATVEGRLVGVYHDSAFLDRGDGVVRLRLASFAEADLAKVIEWAEAYEPARRERPLYKDSEAAITRVVRSGARVAEERSFRNANLNEVPEPEFFLFYYSASWCGPCRHFTPYLKSWYAGHRANGFANFEVFLVSSDRSSFEMLRYMLDAEMPWPAIAHGSRAHRRLAVYGGSSIPQLAVVDRFGNILFHSTVGGEYRGPTAVLADFDPILRASNRFIPDE